MSCSIHLISKTLPGCGLADGRCLPCSGVSGRSHCSSSNSSCADFKLPSAVKFLPSKHASRRASLVCRANYSKFKQFKQKSNHGSSRNRNWDNEDREGYEDLEESETLSSRNGPLSASLNEKFQVIANLNPREKEIIELFQKAQALLRERAAAKKEGKKIQNSQGKKEDNELVDSLSNLLRKHSVQQGKKNNIAANRNFLLDQNDHSPMAEERSTSFPNSRTSFKHEIQETTKPHVRRTVSNSSRKSGVPEIKFRPISISEENVDSGKKQIDLEPEDDDDEFEEVELVSESDSDSESDMEPLFSEENVFDEILTSEIYGTKQEAGIEEENVVGADDLSAMKVMELRNLAKSRGLKGFSKMKKNDLIQFLS